jgi:hypothetical protein
MNIKKLIKNSWKTIRYYLPVSDIPQFVFIVGAQKAGTTALHSYLAMHPKVITGEEKELAFFNRDEVYKMGLRSYRNLFPAWPRGTHALDSTPNNMYCKKSAERIYAFRRDAKIIVLLREPVSRAFSAFNMYRQISPNEEFRKRLLLSNSDTKAFYMPLAEGSIRPDIDYFLERESEIIKTNEEAEEPALIRRGVYTPQLERFFNLFGRENVLVLFSKDLHVAPDNSVNQVLDFIGLEPLRDAEYPQLYVGEYTADTSAKDEIKRTAAALFDQDKQELRDAYGINVPW